MNHHFNPVDEQILDTLRAIVGDGGWASGSESTRHFDDPRGRFNGNACLILFPKSTEQVAEIVRVCNSAKIGIVPISGGNLATNAGGIQVVRHGNARDLCLGIEAVLPNGSVYSELSPLRKNNTGYDLRNLLIGSEGTLGIITAATLVVKPVESEDATVKFDGSISAEHGIGRLKVRDLELYTSDVKIAAIRSIKLALDPNGIMNPGALVAW